MRRLPIYILIDCSASMAGESIEAVRAGLKALVSDLRADPAALEIAYLSVIVVSDKAKQVCPLTAMGAFREPDLEAGGSASLGQALRELLKCADRELLRSTSDRQGDFRPIVFLMADGCPTDDWEKPAEQVRSRRWNVFACAVGPEADRSFLGRITNWVIALADRQPTTFTALFQWISCSVKTAASCRAVARTSNDAVKLPPLPPGIKVVPAASGRSVPVARFGDVKLPPLPPGIKAASKKDSSSVPLRESPAEGTPKDDTECGIPFDSSCELPADRMAEDGIPDMTLAKPSLEKGLSSAAEETSERGCLPEEAKLDENVQFTVFRPNAVQPVVWYPLLAFAHLLSKRLDAPDSEPDPIEEMQRQAEVVLGKLKDDYTPVTQDSAPAIPQGGNLTFLPDFSDLEFNPPSRSFRWLESVHREEFRFQAPLRVQGTTVRGRMTVLLGVTIVADIPLAIRVEAHVDAADAHRLAPPAAARPYRRIFASYSHKDSAIVDQFERFARTMGDDFLRDTSHLRAGEMWSERLERMISEADIFQLFWSHNSMYSAFVEQEWRYALSMNRREFIRPVYWEQPRPEDPDRGLPPEELQRLHFQLFPSSPPKTEGFSIKTSSAEGAGPCLGYNFEEAAEEKTSPGPGGNYTPATQEKTGIGPGGNYTPATSRDTKSSSAVSMPSIAASRDTKSSSAGSMPSMISANGPQANMRIDHRPTYSVRYSSNRWDMPRSYPPPIRGSSTRSSSAWVRACRQAAHVVGALGVWVFVKVAALLRIVVRMVVAAVRSVGRLFG